MKLTLPTIGVLTTVALLASVGVIYANSFESAIGVAPTGTNGGALLLGNVKVTHFDKDGDVIGYRHGSNHITASGMATIMTQVFYDINGTLSIPNSTGRVQWMEIGTDGDPQTYLNALNWNNTDISLPVGGACIRIDATISNTTFLVSAGADPIGVDKSPGTCRGNIFNSPATACSAQMNVTAVAQFDGLPCNAVGIDEAGIYTASTAQAAAGNGGLMFARNTFGSVTLGPLDTLQLEWEFTFTDS